MIFNIIRDPVLCLWYEMNKTKLDQLMYAWQWFGLTNIFMSCGVFTLDWIWPFVRDFHNQKYIYATKWNGIVLAIILVIPIMMGINPQAR